MQGTIKKFKGNLEETLGEQVNVGLWNLAIGLRNVENGFWNLDCDTWRLYSETCRSYCETCIVKLGNRIVKLCRGDCETLTPDCETLKRDFETQKADHWNSLLGFWKSMQEKLIPCRKQQKVSIRSPSATGRGWHLHAMSKLKKQKPYCTHSRSISILVGVGILISS